MSRGGPREEITSYGTCSPSRWMLGGDWNPREHEGLLGAESDLAHLSIKNTGGMTRSGKRQWCNRLPCANGGAEALGGAQQAADDSVFFNADPLPANGVQETTEGNATDAAAIMLHGRNQGPRLDVAVVAASGAPGGENEPYNQNLVQLPREHTPAGRGGLACSPFHAVQGDKLVLRGGARAEPADHVHVSEEIGAPTAEAGQGTRAIIVRCCHGDGCRGAANAAKATKPRHLRLLLARQRVTNQGETALTGGTDAR